MENEQKVPFHFLNSESELNVVNLGDVIDIASASRVHKNEWTLEGVRFFRSSDVTSNFFGKDNKPAFISFDLYKSLIKKTGIVKKGDILVTGGGTIGIPYLIDNDRPLYFKDADLLWLKSHNVIDGYYLYSYFSSPSLQKYLTSISHVGTISHYTIEQAKATPIKLPTFDEQKKIGLFFKNLDELIALHQQELDALKQTKQGFLQKMFPKDGESVPEIRFPVFNDEWKLKKLKEIAEINPKSTLPSEFEYVDLGSVVGTRLLSSLKETKQTAPSRAQRVAKTGDVFYQTVRPYQKNNFLFDLTSDNFVFSTGYAQMRPNIDSYFLLNALQVKSFVVSVMNSCTGTSYPAINSSDLSQLEIMVPVTGEEQVKIGEFFRQLDEVIELKEKELEALIQTKQGFLQKMFV